MKLEKANFLLKHKEEYYFNFSHLEKAKYIAVVKKSLDEKIDDDYYIEIGYKWIPPINIFNKVKSSLKRYSITEILNVKDEIVNDIKNDEVELNFCGEIKLQECDKIDLSTKRYKMLTAGTSVFSLYKAQSSGTIGALFTLNNDDTCIYLISNHHVLASASSKFGHQVVHPSRSDAYFNSLDNPERPIGELFWMNFDNTMDAAIATVDVPVDYNRFSRHEEKIPLGIGKPKIGMKVRKCGRTTGLTHGIIRSINCTTILSDNPYDPEYPGDIPEIFRNQILTNCMSKKGDSGSILIDKNDFAVGLLFAGDGSNVSHYNNLKSIFDSDIKTRNGKKLSEQMFYKFV